MIVDEGGRENLVDMMENDEVGNGVREKELVVMKGNLWRFGGKGYVELWEKYIWKKWYKGGESRK